MKIKTCKNKIIPQRRSALENAKKFSEPWKKHWENGKQ